MGEPKHPYLLSKLYDPQKLGQSHKAIVAGIPPGSSVLDVGCATGFLAGVLAETLSCEVTGVELNAQAAEKAREHCKRVIIGDIASPEMWAEISERYDVLVFADILEHLADPSAVLRQAHDWLAIGGQVIISLPNVAYHKVRLGLLCGKFEYTAYGVLDDSHLRFFTRASARRLIESCGYRIVWQQPVFTTKLRDIVGGWLMPNLCAWQFVFHCAE